MRGTLYEQLCWMSRLKFVYIFCIRIKYLYPPQLDLISFQQAKEKKRMRVVDMFIKRVLVNGLGEKEGGLVVINR